VLALVEERVDLRGRVVFGERHFARRAPHGIDALVLEDPGDPGAQIGAAFEAFLRRERREQRLLHRVLGRLAVAKLQRGIAQQEGSQRFHLGAEVGTRHGADHTPD
jgi:hypothetical protein